MNKRGVVLDIGTGVVVRIWTQVTAIFVLVAAGRVLERQEFGIYSISAVFLVVITTIMYSGIYEYIIKSEQAAAADDTCFWINAGFASLGAFAMVLSAPLIAKVSHAPEIASVMLWLAPSALIAALTSWQEALLLRRKRVAAYYIILCIAETASATLAVMLLLSGMKLFALIGYRYSQLILTSAGYLLYQRDRPHFRWRAEQARLALGFASRLYGSRVIGIITNFSADLIIGALASPAAAGSYRLASRIVFGCSEIWFQPVKTVAWVRFSSSLERTSRLAKTSLQQDWLGLMMLLSMIAWPALGCAAVLSRPLTAAVLGRDWLVAAPVLAVLALAKSAELFEIFLDPLLATTGDLRSLPRIRAAASVIAIAGFLALAHLGATAAAWAQVTTYGLLAGVTIRFGLKRTALGFPTLLARLLPGLVTTLLTMLAAAAAARLTSASALPPVASLAVDLAAGATVWAFMAGAVFRRTAVTSIAHLKAAAS